MTSTVDRGYPRLWHGLVLVCLAGTVWGTIGTAVQLVHEWSGLSPLTISAYRAVVAVGALLAASAATGRLGMCLVSARRQWRRVTVVGLLTATFQSLFFVAVVAVGVGVATVVCLGLAPVLLLIVGSARQRRVPSLGQSLTVAAAVSGLLLVGVAGGGAAHGPKAALGIAAALGSGAAYALSTDVAAPLSRRLDTLTVTTTTMCVAAAVLVPGGMAVARLQGQTLTTTHLRPWLLIVYLGVVTMAFAYALLFAGLRTTPSGTAVVATLLEPVTAVLLAALLLHERLTVTGAVGALLIVAAIAGLGRRDAPTPPHP